jgi:ankyrin repeat protein
MKVKLVSGVLSLFSILSYTASAGANEDLIKAIRSHNTEAVKSAISSGADINKQDENGNLPLAGAAWWPDITKLLLDAKADVNLKSKSGMTPLMNAAMLGETEVAKLLIDAKADVKAANLMGQQALALAAFNGNQSALLKLLLESGADANAKDNLGQTPLFALAAFGKNPTERVSVIKSQIPFLEKAGLTLPERFKNPKESDYSTVEEMIKILIDAGSDVNVEAKAGFTPLMWAAKNNRTAAVKELVTAKADVNKQDVSKHTPLAFAAEAGNIDILKMLVSAGANINAETWEVDDKTKNITKGFTALTRAAMKNQTEVVRVLIELGAKVDEPVSGLGWTNPVWGIPCMYKMSGKTALFYAAENNNLDMVKMLVAAKSDVNAMMKWKFENDCSIKVDFSSPYGIAKSMKYEEVKDYLWEKMKGK